MSLSNKSYQAIYSSILKELENETLSPMSGEDIAAAIFDAFEDAWHHGYSEQDTLLNLTAIFSDEVKNRIRKLDYK